jgi:hypothetical protein
MSSGLRLRSLLALRLCDRGKWIIAAIAIGRVVRALDAAAGVSLLARQGAATGYSGSVPIFRATTWAASSMVPLQSPGPRW